jgi:hypothetical protein
MCTFMYTWKKLLFNFEETGLGHILGVFVTYSSGHPETKLLYKRCHFFFFKYLIDKRN